MSHFAFALLAAAAVTTEWPRFRGPNGTGIAESAGVPVEFGPSKNVLWKAPSPRGVSSPAVAGGRVWITGFDKDDRIVLSFDSATGKEAWRSTIKKARTESANRVHGFASPTPATDGVNGYVFFADIGLLSFDAKGAERWRTPLGPFESIQGHATSPVYHDGLVFLTIDQIKDSHVAAFDAATGKMRWRKDRASGWLGGYATPIVYEPADGPAQLIVNGALELTGYQAKTGERLWWAPGVATGPAASPALEGGVVYTVEPSDEEPQPFKSMAAFDKDKDGKIALTEVADAGMRRLFEAIDQSVGNKDGMVDESEWNKSFESMGKAGGLVATRISGNGQLPAASIMRFTRKSLPYLTAPLAYRGVLYVVRDGGILAARDLATGKVSKEARLDGAIEKYYASPVAADGKIYLASETGKVAVVEAGAEWKMLAVNDLDSPAYATPAIAGGRLYVRTKDTLYCFGK
ncbi:MAG: PQQ-binding-like beta-propeller repeat protein [Bryobacteraceae bacterium]